MAEYNVQELLDAAKPAVVERLKQDLVNAVTWEVKEHATAAIRDHVKAWVIDNVLPEVTEILIGSRDGLVSAAAKLAPALVNAMVEQMTADAVKNLSQSWTRRDLFEKLFKA